jgi:hypothetical protein
MTSQSHQSIGHTGYAVTGKYQVPKPAHSDGFNQSVFRPSNKMSKLFVSTENLSRRLFLSYSALVVELQHSGEVADLK